MNAKRKILTTSVLIVGFLFIITQATTAQCHIDDWTALKALYENTNGDNWTNRDGWDIYIANQSTPPVNCDLNNLFGVSLNIQGRVNGLNLYNNQLTGDIPGEIGNLVYLENLILSNNQLVGTIPSSIQNLSFLSELFLNNNYLNGLIPPELGNLIFLERLHLSNNFLTGNIPSQIGNLSYLLSLSLTDNYFAGSIPTELGDLNNLTHLDLSNNQLSGSLPVELGNLYNLKNLRLANNQLSGNIPVEICNLYNLTYLSLNNNNFTGCYPSCIAIFCEQLFPFPCISKGNFFDYPWEDFCTNGAGACDDNYETPVYPGDLNNNGIVNNQDIALAGFYLYETGSPRNTEHQNTDWYPHPSQGWGIFNNQYADIKHHDCNGDGIINGDDWQAIVDNMHKNWSPGYPPPPSESDYRVILQPIDQIYDGFLVMNVVFERFSGEDLSIQSGYFTVDYSDIEGYFSHAGINFTPISWLGTPYLNLWYESIHFPVEQKIEIGFTKTDGVDSEGNGIIGQLVLVFDNSNMKQLCSYGIEAHTIGFHNSNGDFIAVQDQLLYLNMCSPNCQPNLTIDEDTPFQNLYQSNNITTNGFLLIGKYQEVEYSANRVTLNTSFSVKAGAEFKVRNSGCN